MKDKELEKIIEDQKRTIETYEAVSGVYRKIKNTPLAGKFFRTIASKAKSGSKNNFKVINNVKTKNPKTIGVCNPFYSRGVRSATYSLCRDVYEVSELLSSRDIKRVAKELVSLNPAKVVLSGYPLGYDKLAEEIKRQNPAIKVFAYVHSAFIWFDAFPDENKVFFRYLELQKQGMIEKIAFCKRDVAEYFSQLGYKSVYVMNRFELTGASHKLSKDKIKIGVWGANLWHRNILNQVVAALMIPNTEIHVNEISDLEFLDKKRIVVHGFLPKSEFDKVFSEMDINLYVSLTDCFPMTLIESMSKGIPAIASDTSDVYSFDPGLKGLLVVSTVDGPLGIAKKINDVLDNYSDIQKRIEHYLPKLGKEIERSIEDFLK